MGMWPSSMATGFNPYITGSNPVMPITENGEYKKKAGECMAILDIDRPLKWEKLKVFDMILIQRGITKSLCIYSGITQSVRR